MNINTLYKQLETGNQDDRLREIYGETSDIARQRQRYCDLLMKFKTHYGDQDVQIFSAPGRCEIGGNHCDHQHGSVLAATINMDAVAVVHKIDGIISIQSDAFQIADIDIEDLDKKEEEVGTSEALIRGILYQLRAQGYKVGGFQAYITSDVLVGAGLSSSACFEVLITFILSSLYHEELMDPLTISKISQFAESEYFGKPCGLMDQCACSLGSLSWIDFQNPQAPITKRIDKDLKRYGYCLCILDTSGSHQNLTNAYASIPKEMKQVAAYFHKTVLREVDETQFYKHMAALKENCPDRAILRAMHFFDEHKRAIQEANALMDDDIQTFLKLVDESGNSSMQLLQNIYAPDDPSNQKLTLALALSKRILGSDGVCRVHGGGFAGTIIAIVKQEKSEEYIQAMNHMFGEQSCHKVHIRKFGAVKVF